MSQQIVQKPDELYQAIIRETTEQPDDEVRSQDSKAKAEEPKDEEQQQLIIAELLQSIEQGKPTDMVRSLLQDLASRIAVDHRASITGMDLINQVIDDPQILWKKVFFTQLHRLSDDQKEVVLNWFEQMTKLQEMYVGEIERANNYLKMVACQIFEQLHISDKVKEDFIGKINHVENRVYFNKKLAQVTPGSKKLPGLHMGTFPDSEAAQVDLKSWKERPAFEKASLPTFTKDPTFVKRTEDKFYDGISTSCNLKSAEKFKAQENRYPTNAHQSSYTKPRGPYSSMQNGHPRIAKFMPPPPSNMFYREKKSFGPPPYLGTQAQMMPLPHSRHQDPAIHQHAMLYDQRRSGGGYMCKNPRPYKAQEYHLRDQFY